MLQWPTETIATIDIRRFPILSVYDSHGHNINIILLYTV